MDNLQEIADELVEEFLAKFNQKEKCFAAAAITHDHTFFTKAEEALTEDESMIVDAILMRQAIVGGTSSVSMAVLVGKALKSSLENPIKPKTGLAQRLKDKIKEWLKWARLQLNKWINT